MKKLNIGTKLSGMIGFILILMVLSSGYGIFQIGRINNQVKEIADENNPLSELIVKINMTQLQQAIRFERVLLYSGNGDSENLKKSWREFQKYSDDFAAFMQSAVKITKKAMGNHKTSHYKKTVGMLENINNNHDEYEKHVKHARMLLQKKDTEKLVPHVRELKEKQQALIEETEKMLVFITEMSAKAASIAGNGSKKASTNMLITTIISILAGSIMGFFLTREITVPIKQVVLSLKEIAQGEGDLTKRIEGKRGGEIIALSKWFNMFLDRLTLMIKDTAENSQIVKSESTELYKLSQDLSEDADKTLKISDEVKEAARSMNDKMNIVESSSNTASENIEFVASAAEQLTSTINEIMKNTEKAKSITEMAVNSVMEALVRIEKLGEEANGITRFTETINEISEQTNLLALNATIEAARAGEAGKGFAVVANEIKSLAKQTSEATLDIGEKVTNIQDSTGKSVSEIEKINEVMAEINDIVKTISNALNEQSNATSEIADSTVNAFRELKQMNENVTQTALIAANVGESITTVNQSANSTYGRCSKVNNSVSELNGLSDKLIEMIKKFKA